MSELYFDHHASTPVDPRVAEAMREVQRAPLGNPSSPHAAGRRARAILEDARAKVAGAVHAKPSEVIFTSGGTEACNLGVLGLVAAEGAIVTTEIEHPAVAEAIASLRGREIRRLAFRDGVAPPDDAVRAAIGASCALLAVQSVNHETGTIVPSDRWCEMASDRGALSFVDATQALGKLRIDFETSTASAIALASHKIGGPAGAGALIVRRGVVIDPSMLGGAQEHGLRAGTPDVIAIAGFGVACTLVDARLHDQARIATLRDRIERTLVARGGIVNGTSTNEARVATVVDASFPGWRSSTLVAALDLDGLEVASGAACSSGVDKPSPVVLAMTQGDSSRASSAIRISLGVETTDEDVERAIAILDRVLTRTPA